MEAIITKCVKLCPENRTFCIFLMIETQYDGISIKYSQQTIQFDDANLPYEPPYLVISR